MLVIGLVLAILAPIFAQLIQLGISRKRELLADASGALLTRYPEGLANALRKIGAVSQPMKKANNATAHLFLSNPFGADHKGQKVSWFAKLFMTHPPIEERVAALMGTQQTYSQGA
jgi:heat shock protein HtpX